MAAADTSPSAGHVEKPMLNRLLRAQDMNEPANFDTNLDKPFNWPAERPAWNLKCPENQWDDPPYITRQLSDMRFLVTNEKQKKKENLAHFFPHLLCHSELG